jgi:hypothetical protein
MRKKSVLPALFIAIAFCVIATALNAQSAKSRLQQTFDLAGKRAQATQYFLMESKLISYAFENLTDSAGKPLPSDQTYHVYNAFIDFHSFCNVFAERAANGSGIQDLKRIGQKIVHVSAFSEPPVNLGSQILPGSSFKNGEITLAFKGLSMLNGKQCALVEYDSGESSFKMLMQPTPEMQIQTVGSSHYFGDIYKDLSTNWVQKVTMAEFVVAEVALPMPPNKINSVVERHITILNVREDELGLQSQ